MLVIVIARASVLRSVFGVGLGEVAVWGYGLDLKFGVWGWVLEVGGSGLGIRSLGLRVGC